MSNEYKNKRRPFELVADNLKQEFQIQHLCGKISLTITVQNMLNVL